MTPPDGRRSWGRRTTNFLQTLLVYSIVGGAALLVALTASLEYTAQPEFCLSCHIMDPYYESWKSSSHNNVPCIECHYEPGSIETMEGKFKALSQVAKYVTRTQGTKPWAEISDQSCMRSGCHTTRLLEGTIQFGRVKFDHRHHLLESRRGRRLRCTSCHSQVVQGSHMSVTESVCFACHFKPGPEPEASSLGDCRKCHGPPTETVLVAGRPFLHAPYVERGVECQECHRRVVRGDGRVGKERCRACHAEVGHIERFEEQEFLHEMHVTSHKVECFECHDEIEHGLAPMALPEPPKDGCASCHVMPHDPVRQLYAGTGAVGVADRPSRMFQTRLECEACHSGLSGVPGQVGEVDCVHCHGTGYDGMVGRWQASVQARLEKLVPPLEELGRKLGQAPAHPAWSLYSEAKQNVDLIQNDRSRGAHNVTYALDALQASAERIAKAIPLVDPTATVPDLGGPPLRVAEGCTDSCHVGVELLETVPMLEKTFPHRQHLDAGLECGTCHSIEKHGEPEFPRDECNACHE